MLAAELRVALHGVDDAARVVDVVLERQAPRAEAPPGDRVVLVALHVVDDPVLVHVDLEAAAHGVAPRRRPHGRAHDGEVPLLVLPWLAKIVLELHVLSFPCFSSFWPAAVLP